MQDGTTDTPAQDAKQGAAEIAQDLIDTAEQGAQYASDTTKQGAVYPFTHL